MNRVSPESALPHRGAMVLLEHIVDWGEDWIEARARKERLQMFRSPDGSISTVAAMELICQAAASHAGLCELAQGKPVRIGFIIGARSLDFHANAFLQAEAFHVSVRHHYKVDEETGVYAARLFAEDPSGPLIASGTITAVMPQDSRSVLDAIKT